MNQRLSRMAVLVVAALSALSACGPSAVGTAGAPATSAAMSTTPPARATAVPTASLTPLPRSTKQFDLPVGTETTVAIVGYRVGGHTVIAIAVSDAVWQPAGACSGTPIGEYLTVTIRETVISGQGTPLEQTDFSFVGANGREADRSPYSGCNHPALDVIVKPTNGILVGQVTFDVQTGHRGKVGFSVNGDAASWIIS